MNRLYLLSWYYQATEGEAGAREFFGKLREGNEKGKRFPFPCPSQVGLVHCTAEDHWCVGILVMRDAPGDDSVEQTNLLHKWFAECGADSSGTEKTGERASRPSIEGTLRDRFGDRYICVETFEPSSASPSAVRKAGTEADVLSILPLAGLAAFPYAVVPLVFGNPHAVRLVEEAAAGNRRIGLVTSAISKSGGPGPADLFSIGTAAGIHNPIRTPDGGIRFVAEGLSRFRIVQIMEREPYLTARVEYIPESDRENDKPAVLADRVRDSFRKAAKSTLNLPDELIAHIDGLQDPLRVAYTVANFLPLDANLSVKILEADRTDAKLELLLGVLEKTADPGMGTVTGKEGADIAKMVATLIAPMPIPDGLLAEIKNAGEPAIEPLIRALREGKETVKPRVGMALEKMGALAVEPLIQVLKDGDKYAKSEAARVLGSIRDSRAVEPLIGLFRDKEERPRWSAAFALKNLGEAAVEPLLRVLPEQNESLQILAASALGRPGNGRAVEPLLDVFLKTKVETVRSAAAKALGEIKDERAARPLLEAFRMEEDMQEAASDALGGLKSPCVVEAMIRVLRSEEGESAKSRSRAARILGEIGDPSAVEPLISAMQSEDTGLTVSARYALVKIGRPATEQLIHALLHGDTRVQTGAAKVFGESKDAQAVDALIAVSKNVAADPFVRGAAIGALGDIGDARAVEPLRALLADEIWGIRGTSKVALEKIGGKKDGI